MSRDKQMIRLLADRLAMALAILEGCELDAGIGKDQEGQEFWQRALVMLLGYDDAGLEECRAEMRKWGEYQSALTKVRALVSRSVGK
jgi:hypothetical protein